MGKTGNFVSTCASSFFIMSGFFLRPVAAEAPVFSVTPEIAEYVNGVINESVNANTLFATQDTISTGHFLQRRNGEPDKGYHTLRLPGELVFGENSDPVRLVLTGNGAILRATSGLAPMDGVGESDFAVTNLYAASGGVGAYIKLSDSVQVAPMLSLTYSHIQNSYDFNNSFSQIYLAQAERDLFNWDMDLFTYAPALKLFYEEKVGSCVLNYKMAYTYLFNDSIRTESSIIKISSSTGLLTNRVELLTPLGVDVAGAPLAIRPIFQWSNISGSAVAGLGLRDLFETGVDLVASIVEADALLSNITVGASYVSGKDFEGYHIGLGLNF